MADLKQSGLGALGGAAALAVVLLTTGSLKVGPADLGDVPSVSKQSNETMMKTTITEPINGIKALETEAPRMVERPVYDTNGVRNGTVTEEQTRLPRDQRIFDVEAVAGEAFFTICGITREDGTDSVFSHVVYAVADLPDGKICKLSNTNDYAIDKPATR